MMIEPTFAVFVALYQFPMYFTPRSPDEQIDGKIISVFDGVSIIGAYQIVTLNRGRSQGLEPGHVLAVYQAGRVERDHDLEAYGGIFPRLDADQPAHLLEHLALGIGVHQHGQATLGAIQHCPAHRGDLESAIVPQHLERS